MKRILLTLSLSTFVMLLPFQNCSKISFQSSGESVLASKTDTSGLNHEMGTADPVVHGDGAAGAPTDPIPNVHVAPIVGNSTSHSNCQNSRGEDENDDEEGDQDSDHDCEAVTLVSYREPTSNADKLVQDFMGQLKLESFGSVTLTHVEGSIQIKNIGELLSAQDLRGRSEIQAVQIDQVVNFSGDAASFRANAIQHVENGAGHLSLASFKLDQLLNHKGRVCVTAQSARLLQNIKGDLQVAGPSQQARAEVDEILDTVGVLKLVNVHLKHLQNHKGAIQLVNSVIDVQD